MSKTFKCVEHEEEVLEVYPFTGEEGGRKFSLLMPHVSSNAGIAFDSTTAPALALAILEAAGVEESSPHYGLNDSPEWNLRWASHYLGRSIELTNTQAAEAEAQAKLEAEALELFKTLMGYKGYENFTWSEVIDKDEWLAVARKARELNKEDNNA